MKQSNKAITDATIILILVIILALITLSLFFSQADKFLSILKG